MLDARARGIVRIPAQGSARLGRVPLRIPGVRRLAGLAYNPADGLLYVTSPADSRLYALDRFGEVAKVYSLKGLRLREARAILFAPSADPTDDPTDTAPVHRRRWRSCGRRKDRRGDADTRTVGLRHDRDRHMGQHDRYVAVRPTEPPGRDRVCRPRRIGFPHQRLRSRRDDDLPGSDLYTGTRTGSGSGTGSDACLEPGADRGGLRRQAARRTSRMTTGTGSFVVSPRARRSPRDKRRCRDVLQHVRASAAATPKGSSTTRPPVTYSSPTGSRSRCSGQPRERCFSETATTSSPASTSASTGPGTPEGMGIDIQRGLLLVVDPSTKSVYELTKSGSLVGSSTAAGIPTGNRAFRRGHGGLRPRIRMTRQRQ